ncbi:MAG: NUDIX hydrolase [Actinomycetota bacterium]
MSEGFRHVGDELVHRTVIFDVVTGTFTDPDGATFERAIVRHRGAVGVVAVVDDAVVLVRQYRAPIDGPLLELPAGIRDVDGEDPGLTAIRELAEETGLRAGRVEHLSTYYTAAGFTDETVHLYQAFDLVQEERDAHGPEEAWMTIERLPLDEIDEAIASGRIVDAKTIIGLQLVRRP